jgi:hypothetical protein
MLSSEGVHNIFDMLGPPFLFWLSPAALSSARQPAFH